MPVDQSNSHKSHALMSSQELKEARTDLKAKGIISWARPSARSHMASPGPRQTKLQSVSKAAANLEEGLLWLRTNESEWQSEKAQQLLQSLVDADRLLGKELPALVAKASEINPDKRTYGKAVSENVSASSAFFRRIGHVRGIADCNTGTAAPEMENRPKNNCKSFQCIKAPKHKRRDLSELATLQTLSNALQRCCS